jgi:hypothetical protein
MFKVQFKMSIQPGIGIYGIGYLLDLYPVVVRNSPKGYEIAPARPFEEVTVLGGVTFHAIIDALFWETTLETEKRIKNFSDEAFENKIPTTTLTNWSEGEEIGNPSHFVIRCVPKDGSSMVAEKRSLAFAGDKAACDLYLSTLPSNEKETYKIISVGGQEE